MITLLANLVLGLFSPFKFDIPTYLGYNITRLKDHFRTLEVLVSRDGEVGGLIPLFFDGATCDWYELPRPDSDKMKAIYEYADSLNKKEPNKNVVLLIKEKLKKK